MIQNAIDSKVDGIAVSMPDPDALAAPIKAAVDAGIPVVVYNAGDRDWQKSGGLAFFGEPEVLARRVRRHRAERAGRHEGTVRPAGTGPGAAGRPLRGHGLDVHRHDREALRRRYGRRRPTPPPCTPSSSPTRRSTRSSPSTRRWVSLIANDVKASGGRSDRRHLRLQSRPHPAAAETAASPSPSTSSPGCRATWPSTPSGCTSTTTAFSGANLSIPTGPVVVDKSNIDSIIPFIEQDLR